MSKIIAVLPTYNEAGNIRELITELLALPHNLSVLVVDDNSPDGTAELAEELARNEERLRVIKNPERTGRGSSGRQGFLEALKAGAEWVLEMDADFSHRPQDVPALLEAAPEADLVIGSRFCVGGRIEGRSVMRDVSSSLAEAYLQLLLDLEVKDPSSGFRLWKKETLQAIDCGSLRSRGPFIVTESLYRVRRKGLTVVEVPITFQERKAGESKLKLKTLLNYLWLVLKLRIDPDNFRGY